MLDINGDEDWKQGYSYMKYELNIIEKYKDGVISQGCEHER